LCYIDGQVVESGGMGIGGINGSGKLSPGGVFGTECNESYSLRMVV